jgi:hypothetical protein
LTTIHSPPISDRTTPNQNIGLSPDWMKAAAPAAAPAH